MCSNVFVSSHRNNILNPRALCQSQSQRTPSILEALLLRPVIFTQTRLEPIMRRRYNRTTHVEGFCPEAVDNRGLCEGPNDLTRGTREGRGTSTGCGCPHCLGRPRPSRCAERQLRLPFLVSVEVVFLLDLELVDVKRLVDV